VVFLGASLKRIADFFPFFFVALLRAPPLRVRTRAARRVDVCRTTYEFGRRSEDFFFPDFAFFFCACRGFVKALYDFSGPYLLRSHMTPFCLSWLVLPFK